MWQLALADQGASHPAYPCAYILVEHPADFPVKVSTDTGSKLAAPAT